MNELYDLCPCNDIMIQCIGLYWDTLCVCMSSVVVDYISCYKRGFHAVFCSDNMNLSTFAGPGAGRFPTANSVLNDIIRLAQGVC